GNLSADFVLDSLQLKSSSSLYRPFLRSYLSLLTAQLQKVDARSEN
ncbi:hypothetical protein A2U01_0078663, partial [Trifolium medium]|nr:hypothetical protein [Trifolium medium]